MTTKEKLKALREQLTKQLKAMDNTIAKIHLINSNIE
jgi:hypothetical protein